MPLVIFSHGNSFGASTYRVMLDSVKKRGFSVKAVERYGHDPLYPVSSNWPKLVQQCADFARKEVEKAGEPAFFVGHSLGGFLSMMCAARHPELARGVVLIDSPMIGGWRATALGVVKRTQLVGSLSPGAVSRKRKNAWPDQAAALEHFQRKKVFQRWDPQVLQDYVEHGTHDAQDGRRMLSFDRDVETAIYNTLPHNLDRLLAQHPLKCPAAFIGGLQSEEMRRVGMAFTQKVTGGRIMLVDGTHLFPMERPLMTAAAIEASLRNLGA